MVSVEFGFSWYHPDYPATLPLFSVWHVMVAELRQGSPDSVSTLVSKVLFLERKDPLIWSAPSGKVNKWK
jgi:hypothetical protein